MTKRFKIGDHVAWNSEAGRVSGTIIAIHTTDFDYKNYIHHASENDPQYEIRSDKTDHIAAHKGSALERIQMAAALPFFTVGHSNRSLEEFVALLKGAGVERLIDVRRIPKSRTNPQFNKETLPESLRAFDISYEHVASLGGLRKGALEVPRELNGFWTHESFHNYADYALSDRFHEGLEHLLGEGVEQCCAIMCSEAVWWRCHRRIVADYLIAAGRPVIHIMSLGRLEPARLTTGAVVRSDGAIVYPAADRLLP